MSDAFELRKLAEAATRRDTLMIIERLIVMRDRMTDRGDRDLIADACNGLSRTAEMQPAVAALLDEMDALRWLVTDMVENDPDELVSDGGHTLLDLWRHDARKFLQTTKESG